MATKLYSSSNGCWTCRLRRKKCDENQPVCGVCAALYITCYYGQGKPEWMDGGARQEEMAIRFKREVKEKAHRRRGERSVNIPVNQVPITQAINSPSTSDLSNATAANSSDKIRDCPGVVNSRLQCDAMCKLNIAELGSGTAIGRSDMVLLMFYLEHLLPFLFPFYHPSILQGGKAWVLEMMISSPVLRKATLCQSSYFFSLAQRAANCDIVWGKVLSQTREAFEVLGKSLQIIDASSITEHTHGIVRVMASIMQLQRFEITVLSFKNCQAHLNAALALFKQLMDTEFSCPGSRFEVVMNRLGPSAWLVPSLCFQVPSAEQAAFRFSTGLLIFDDIIASTVLQEPPRLYEYHRSLLGNLEGKEPHINLEAIIGCQNWALLQIGEIAVLDAWKQQCTRDGNLDIMDLVRRATTIKEDLEKHLTHLENNPQAPIKDDNNLMDVFKTNYGEPSKLPVNQSPLITRVWAHAALIYLHVVVSGWQPANIDVRYHVCGVLELLTHKISHPALLRTMVWPFCISGCLAEPGHETQFRAMVEVLQPPSVFGTARKAFEVMESVWRDRGVGDTSSRDLAACLKGQGDLVLLV